MITLTPQASYLVELPADGSCVNRAAGMWFEVEAATGMQPLAIEKTGVDGFLSTEREICPNER